MKPDKSEIVLFKESSNAFAQERIERLEEAEPLVVLKRSTNPTAIPASDAFPTLFKTKGAWPFDLYQDEMTIEKKRIILKRNYFPWFSNVLTIPIKNLITFAVTRSIFFSSIYMKWGYTNAETTFQWLRHSDAQEAMEIMDGIRLSENESIMILEQDKKKHARAFQYLGQI